MEKKFVKQEWAYNTLSLLYIFVHLDFSQRLLMIYSRWVISTWHLESQVSDIRLADGSLINTFTAEAHVSQADWYILA